MWRRRHTLRNFAAQVPQRELSRSFLLRKNRKGPRCFSPCEPTDAGKLHASLLDLLTILQ